MQPEPLMVAGAGTAINGAFDLLGRKNIASGAKGSYPRMSVEEVIARLPDVIFLSKRHTVWGSSLRSSEEACFSRRRERKKVFLGEMPFSGWGREL